LFKRPATDGLMRRKASNRAQGTSVCPCNARRHACVFQFVERRTAVGASMRAKRTAKDTGGFDADQPGNGTVRAS
jgi:hypothetical protein